MYIFITMLNGLCNKKNTILTLRDFLNWATRLLLHVSFERVTEKSKPYVLLQSMLIFFFSV